MQNGKLGNPIINPSPRGGHLLYKNSTRKLRTKNVNKPLCIGVLADFIGKEEVTILGPDRNIYYNIPGLILSEVPEALYPLQEGLSDVSILHIYSPPKKT